MSLFKKAFYHAASVVPISLLRKKQSIELLLPYAHLISDERVRHVSHLYSYKNRNEFIKDLDYLLRRFKPLHPEALFNKIRNNENIPPQSFLLSFDDGLREIHEVVRPILLQKGIPALFFINPAFIDNRQLFYRFKLSLILEALSQGQKQATWKEISRILGMDNLEKTDIKRTILRINYLNRALADQLGNCLEIPFTEYLTSQKPFLETKQIKELLDDGFGFGAHSMDHPQYHLLNLEDQIAQTVESCRYIKDHFNLPYSFFSFPHQDAGLPQDFFDRLFIQDELKIDLLFGTQNQKKEMNNLMMHRFNAERPGISMEQLIKGMMIYRNLNQLTGKGITRKNAER